MTEFSDILEIFAEAQHAGRYIHELPHGFHRFRYAPDVEQMYRHTRTAGGICQRCPLPSGGKTKCPACVAKQRTARHAVRAPVIVVREAGWAPKHPASYYREYRARKKAERLAIVK
jgi:hypothetical protein